MLVTVRAKEFIHKLPAISMEVGMTQRQCDRYRAALKRFKRSPLDVLITQTDPDLVAMELDLYWTVKAGKNPIDYFKQYPGRFKLWHVKDLAEDGSFADVGTGTINFKEIFAHGKLAGVEHKFVERDQTTDRIAAEVLEALAAESPAEISQNGTTTAPAHMLFDIVRKLPDGSQVELDTSDGDEQLTLRSGQSLFTLACLPVEDFPATSHEELACQFQMPAPLQLKPHADRCH